LISSFQKFFFHISTLFSDSHEDIKDAMLSLVHMMRENTEKLERHEARERQLGEQLKKTMTILTKRVSSIDGLKVQLTKLDERVAGIERLIVQVCDHYLKYKLLEIPTLCFFFVQKDERERIQMQKTTDILEDLESRLESWLADIDSKINSRQENAPESNNNDVIDKLNSTESNLIDEIARLKTHLHSNTAKMDKESSALTGKAHAIFSEVIHPH